MSKSIAIKSLSVVLDAQSLGTDLESSAINLNNIEGYSVQFTWSAGSSPVGLVKLRGSNDEEDGYIDIQEAVGNVSGASGSIMFDVATHSYKFVKVTYTRTSGSGTVTATMVTRSRA